MPTRNGRDSSRQWRESGPFDFDVWRSDLDNQGSLLVSAQDAGLTLDDFGFLNCRPSRLVEAHTRCPRDCTCEFCRGAWLNVRSPSISTTARRSRERRAAE